MIRRLIGGVATRAELIRAYLYDWWRMVRYSSTLRRDDNPEKVRALITMQYHGVEKGLSVPRPRGGFGRKQVDKLIRMLNRYVRTWGVNSTVRAATNALHAYVEFNRKMGMPDDGLSEKIGALDRLLAEFPEIECDTTGGCRTLTKRDLLEAAQAPFERFSQLRYTVRQFSGENVDLETIRSAVRIAQKTPSVCNRQSWRVWVVQQPDKIAGILEVGGGARGFEDQMKVLLVVTSDLAYFYTPGERNQCWIDGGMFGMSLIYALHAKGLVSCCMNWCKTRRDDVRLRRMMGMPASEAVIFLLGVGCPRDECLVAASARKPLDDVIRYWGDAT